MILLLIAGLSASLANQPLKPVVIGTHYTNDLAGLVAYRSAKESVLLSIGWTDKAGRQHEGYNDLVAATLRFGEAAPDDSYHRISWQVGGATVTYEWGLTAPDEAAGRVSADRPVEIRLRMGSAWPGSEPGFAANAKEILERAGSVMIRFDATGPAEPSGATGGGWSEKYRVDKGNPVRFSFGVGAPNVSGVDRELDNARTRYKATRLWAEGDWGDFLSPIENQLGNSKVYSIDTGRVAHIVSRRWCLPDGQVLFCWDSFFNGLLSSLEDPAGAKRTIRAVLAAETPDGFVANFSGRGWGTSNDRSQPCDGAYCVWKIYQRAPDLAFLRETYPKLLSWHQWWFARNPKDGLPFRDGNRDGLLEWGSQTGDLQNAKFESGLDDSPMFDDGAMSGPHMTTDATDLCALWALDADYLARIADAIGKPLEAKELRQEKSRMVARINAALWNPMMNAYCYRYWTPRQPMVDLDQPTCMTADGQPGLKGEYFVGRDLQGEAKVRQDAKVDFNWPAGPIEEIGHNNFSARWTGQFTAPASDPYVFEATSDDGVRLWIDDKKVLDGWSIHGSTRYDSAPISFDAGSTHQIRLEYFQAEGGAEIHFSVRKIEADRPGAVFSKRLSPLNFYPLMADAPTPAMARKTLDLFFQPTKFGGPEVCPTIARDDPAFPAQGYWRGTVWGPTSYLTFIGVRKYATDREGIDYAEKSVRLFMKNWIADGTCRENFNVATGKHSSDPHYTWGALLCLLGLEELCDLEPDGRVRLNGDSGRHIKVHNLRLKGRLYDLTIEPKRAILRENGRSIAVARGKVARFKLP